QELVLVSKMIQNWLRSGFILLVLAAALQAQDRDTLIHSINKDVWTAGKATTYNDSTIDNLGPELAASLRAYGFDGVTVQSWRGTPGEVRATLFQLVDASSAYGFFTVRRKAESTSL